jgi:hypothetical protein
LGALLHCTHILWAWISLWIWDDRLGLGAFGWIRRLRLDQAASAAHRCCQGLNTLTPVASKSARLRVTTTRFVFQCGGGDQAIPQLD